MIKGLSLSLSLSLSFFLSFFLSLFLLFINITRRRRTNENFMNFKGHLQLITPLILYASLVTSSSSVFSLLDFFLHILSLSLSFSLPPPTVGQALSLCRDSV